MPQSWRKFYCTRGEYVAMSNGVVNFNFLALFLSEILGGSQISFTPTDNFTTRVPPPALVYIKDVSCFDVSDAKLPMSYYSVVYLLVSMLFLFFVHWHVRCSYKGYFCEK